MRLHHPSRLFVDPGWREYGADCDSEAHVSDMVPDVEVDLPLPEDEPPVLLGPDGQPLPRTVWRFGFAAAPVEV